MNLPAMKTVLFAAALMLPACGSEQSDQGVAAPALAPYAVQSSPHAASKPSHVTSAYTAITEADWDRCAVTESAEEWEVRKCAGYGTIPLFVEYGDIRYDIDAGVRDEHSLFPGPPHGFRDTIEWRLSDGKPFAIIYRFEAPPSYEKWARLMVETVGAAGKPGCRIAEINGLRRDANAAARAAADRVLTGDARCLKEG